MKILHVIPSVSELRGGPSRAVLDMVKALRAAKIDAVIATTNDNGPQLLDVPLGHCINYQDVPVYFFSRFSPRVHSVSEFAFSGPLTKWAWHHLADYDLVHIHAAFSYASTATMSLARLQHVPYVVTLHGLLCGWSMRQSRRKKQFYLSIAERSNLNHARALHFTSTYEQQESASLQLKAPAMMIPFGLEVPPLIPNARSRLHQWLEIPPDEPVILFMSRLHPVKGLDYLIPALGQVANQRFHFIIAGSGSPEYEAEIQQLLSKAQLQARTHCVGFVQGEPKDLLLQGADLLVQTSKLESFGIAVLEALASGTPVLVTPAVAIASLVKQQQLGYVAELDITSIANTLAYFLDHSMKSNTTAKHVREFVENGYTWEKVARQLVEMYQKILQNQPVSMFLG